MPESFLQAHCVLCDQAYDLLLEENRILKDPDLALDESFLIKKTGLLKQLDESITNLKKINQSPPVEGLRRSKLIQTAQNKTMKLMLLDRENEQLLHDKDFKRKQMLADMPKPSASALRAYKST